MKRKRRHVFGDYFEKNRGTRVVFILETYKYYPNQNVYKNTIPKLALVVYKNNGFPIEKQLKGDLVSLSRYDGGTYFIEWSHQFFISNLYSLPCSRNWFYVMFNGDQYCFIIRDFIDITKGKGKDVREQNVTSEIINWDIKYKRNWKNRLNVYFNKHPEIESKSGIRSRMTKEDFNRRINKKIQRPSYGFRAYGGVCICVNCEEPIFKDGLCRKHYMLERTTK